MISLDCAHGSCYMDGYIYILASYMRIVQDKACCEKCGRVYTPLT